MTLRYFPEGREWREQKEGKSEGRQTKRCWDPLREDLALCNTTLRDPTQPDPF